MNRHLPVEVISAYVDGELTSRRRATCDEHLAHCSSCRERLAGLDSAVNRLRRLDRVAPPASVGDRVNREIARVEERSEGVWGRLRAHLSFPGMPALSTTLRFSLALLLTMMVLERRGTWLGFAVGPAASTWLSGDRLATAPPAPEFRVVAAFGDAPMILPQTTSEVAGRVFVFTDDGWVQRGLDGSAPEARVRMNSAQGRLLLAQLAGLNVLLADGSRVVLRYQLRTLELSNR